MKPRTLKNLVDTWLRQALDLLPNSLVPPRGRGGVCIEVQRTRDARHGDFASNLAMRLASSASANPRVLAEAIKSALPADAALARVEIGGAGFINFFLSEHAYHDEIRRALRDDAEYGRAGNEAARSFCLMRGGHQPLFFDLDRARTRSMDNPLYSIQYAHARIVSVRRQIEDRGLEVDAARGGAVLGLLVEPCERALMRRVSAFPEFVERSAEGRAPPVLARYLRGLARDFHLYHGAHPIVVPEAALRDARVALASAVGVAIRNGLHLLGVAAPDSV